jgi:hypothetical protein
MKGESRCCNTRLQDVNNVLRLIMKEEAYCGTASTHRYQRAVFSFIAKDPKRYGEAGLRWLFLFESLQQNRKTQHRIRHEALCKKHGLRQV